MTHSKNDKESHPFFKPNQGNKGKNQQHRYMNNVESHRDIKQNNIQNEKIHSSQWTYLECLLEPDLLVFKLCFSLSRKYPPGLLSPNSVPFFRKTIGFVSQEIPAHPLTTLFSPMSAFLLFPKPHLLKTLPHVSLPSIFQTPSLHPTCSVFLSFFIHLLASLTSFYRIHCYWFNEDIILNHHHGKMVMSATHPCSLLHLEIVSYLSKK